MLVPLARIILTNDFVGGENQGHKQCQAKLKSRSSYSVKSKKCSKRAFEEAKESEALPNKAFKCNEIFIYLLVFSRLKIVLLNIISGWHSICAIA